jgi:hypothetical protein
MLARNQRGVAPRAPKGLHWLGDLVPDVWATFAELESSVQERLAAVLETRGADILHSSGTIGEATAAALKSEARRRVEAGTFFSRIAYASLTTRKPPRATI